MNILILTTHLNPGGLSRYVLNLSTALKRQNHKVWVACSGGEWVPRLIDNGVNYKHIPIKTKSICSPKILFSFLALDRLIQQENFDIVHCNTRVTQFLGFLIGKCFNLPYISAYHGFYRRSIFRKKFKLSGVRSIAVSRAVKEHLINDLNIEGERIKVVYNGIDNDEFLSKETNRGDWGFKNEDYLIGILGRVSQEKGHFLAVDAIAELSARHKNAYLLVSGRGRLDDKLRAYLRQKKLEQRVKFIDCQPNQFLDIIDLLLVPSQKEGFGYSILEAFIKGVPVIGYNTGGIAEIIRDRENGLLFYNYKPSALVEKIENIISNDNLRRKIVQQARKDVLDFSSRRMAIDTEKVYREIC
ncbi:MAG: glycosyltransferase family 4 protein [Candidatus Omnitrophica bacterium]|nr:glycosyltransferase family 4 protein [Candidatus Omnitrophota bacterium]